MKRKRVSAQRGIEECISQEELEANAISNLSLVFCPKSPLFEFLNELRDQFIAELSQAELPSGFSPPISSGSKRQAVSRRNVETLLANLLDMIRKGNPTLSVSLNEATYRTTKLSSSGYINLIKLAAHKSRGLLILKEGFHNHLNKSQSRTARIKPTRKFSKLLETAIVNEDDLVSEPHELINLRRSKTKEIIPRRKWMASLNSEQLERLRALEMSLYWFNLVLLEYDISYANLIDSRSHNLFPVLYTVFTDTFQQGGRFYTGRGGHQGLRREERASIEFNGHPTIELDYGGLHIRMLYHLMDCDYPLDSDPYAEVLDSLGMDANLVFEEYPSIRDDLKRMLLALVNGRGSKRQSINRAEWRLFRDWMKVKNTVAKNERKMECHHREKVWASVGLTVAKVLDAFEDAHHAISNYFSIGCGLDLQYLDATIARWVMFDLMVSSVDECIPVLPIHDSFITFSAYSERLRNTMRLVYQEIMRQKTGFDRTFRIPIK